MKILFIGDIVGKPGRTLLQEKLGRVVQNNQIDLCIANCENVAGGFGVTLEIINFLEREGVQVFTSGNHVWDKKEIYQVFEAKGTVLRPQNYPEGIPGRGFATVKTASGVCVGVLNLAGRIFMDHIDCPFRAADKALASLKKETNIIIVDMHAEATSEKIAMGWYLDGRVSAVLGTHTHVQTSDEKILPNGTAYITDVGMTGPIDSVIGMKKEIAISRFLTRIPKKFEPAPGDAQFNGVIVQIDEATGKGVSITRDCGCE
ncbi:MAG: TIGR00282 family metallophosphoesterase [Nitrospinae bacterium]|nr:TIGR00282 family metallophosphoesterase [Nitrospinota bacterium]